MCCLVCNQTVLGLTSLHVHLSQHESGLQATPSNENKHEMELQTIRPDDTNSPHSDDCALPETSHANSYMGRSFESSTEMNIQELQSNEAIPPLDKLDLQDNPLCPDLPEESDEESSTTKFISPCSDDNRPSSRCSFTDLKFPVQANSPSTSSQYSCDECGLMFSSQHFLVWHKDVIHKHSDCFEVSCKLCKKKFPNLETYRNHVRENHNEQRYMCEKCPKTFKLRGSLVVHKRMYHDGTPSICQFCYKKFPSDTRRDFHERRHHASCGKSNTKGKLSQDLELSFPLKRTLQNNSIQKACRNLDNLIQKNACHSKFPENFLSNSSSISTKTSSPLSVPTMANSQTSSSETASFYAEPPTTSQKETNFKEQMKGEKNEGLMNPRIPVTPLEDPLVKLNPGDDHLALESSKSRLNIVDVHEQELLQNVGIVTEKAQSTGTPPGKSYDILLQHSEPRNMDDKMHYSPEKVADTKNVVPLPHCVKNFDSVPELCSFSGNAQINVIVSPDSSQLNTPAIAHTNGSKVEFYSSNSTCPRNQTSKKSRSKPESDSLFKILLEKNVECSKANNLPSSEIHTRQASIAGSPNTREFKKDLDKNHQNQKVGLPAFLGCDGKPWECDVCKKCFTTKYFLKKHKRLHTGETPYMCSECGKTFTFQQSYHKHLLYHSDDKPHVCSYCGRAFKEMSTLHNHVRIHTGEKPFVCETCGKAFRQRVSYLVHRRIHTGVLPYTCHECQKSFRYKVSLRSHKCEKAGRELSSTSTNSPLKETQSESDDLSSRNAHPTVSDFDQNVEENESNFSETLWWARYEIVSSGHRLHNMESWKHSNLYLLLLLVIGCSCTTVAGEAACNADTIGCLVDSEYQCLDPSWLCDDFSDCDGGEDETPQLCKSETTTVAPVTTQASFGDDSLDYDAVADVGKTAGHQFAYLGARVYRYSYSVAASAQVLATSDRQSNFSVDVDVALSIYSACEMVLKVEKAKMTASTSDGGEITITENEFLDSLKTNDLRFAMDRGLVDTVCPRQDERMESLNFKRGLLALLQNTMPRFDLSHSTRENDVLGMCDVVYKFNGTNNTAFVIEKTKDVDSCSGEFDVFSAVKSVPYAFIGGYQSAPVFTTSSSCRHNIDDKRIRSAECIEKRKLTPFSSNQGGVVTSLKQNLQFQYSSFTSLQRGAIHRRTKLNYEFSDNEGTGDKSEERSEEEMEDPRVQRTNSILTAIAEHMKVTRSSVAKPSDFADLVRILRTLTSAQLIQLADDTNWGKNWLVFQDAVPAVGTAGSVLLMKHILDTRQNFDRASEWLRSLAYISRPDLKTLEAASSLLTVPAVKSEVFLGIGALVNAYCQHDSGCQAHEEVQHVMELLHGFIQNSCVRSTSQEKIQTLLAIKGIGNAGRAATARTVELLKACITVSEPSYNEDEIRITAVNAFRRFQCNLTAPLNEFFSDMREDSEMRILSYVNLMRCANYDTLASVLSVLRDEDVNQDCDNNRDPCTLMPHSIFSSVGSFIWTHLTNIQEGSLPSRLSVQGLLSNQKLQEKFRTDVRKFSRNYEWSAFYDPLNIGGGVESNVIFSQKSYIPRSASLNFTTDLFGQSINWLELETRVEGFERPLENMFMGTMPNPVPASDGILDRKVRSLIEMTGAADAYRRKQPELSVAMRTFGNDVFFEHLHGARPIRDALDKLDPLILVERLNKGETLSLQKSVRPIESMARIATSSGLPLSVELMGTVSLDILARATIEFGSLNPANFDPRVDIRGTLTPSVVSEVLPHYKSDVSTSLTLITFISVVSEVLPHYKSDVNTSRTLITYISVVSEVLPHYKLNVNTSLTLITYISVVSEVLPRFKSDFNTSLTLITYISVVSEVLPRFKSDFNTSLTLITYISVVSEVLPHYKSDVNTSLTLVTYISVASEVSASVRIDGVAAVAGVEVAASLSSSSTLSGRINANGLSTFNLDLSMPNEKVEFINITSNLFLLHGSAASGDEDLEIEAEALDAVEGVETQDCTPYSTEIGAHACWAIKFPNSSAVDGSPSFPLTGPAHLQVFVTKTDPQLHTYQIRYSFTNDFGDRRLLLSANTPGTAVDREHSVFASLNSVQQTADLKVHTPKGLFDAKGRYVWERLIKKLDMVCQLNGQVVAEVELSLTRHEKRGRQNFIPVAKIKWRGRELFNLGGEVEALEKQGSQVYSLNLEFSANTPTPTQQDQIRGQVHGEIKEEPTEKSINLDIDYEISGDEHRATVEYSLINASDDVDFKFVSDSEVTFSQFPTLNLVWSNSYRVKPGSAEMNIKINFGENFLDDNHAVFFHRSLTFLHSEEQTHINSTLALTVWRDVSSRLQLRKTPSPLLDGSGSFNLRIPSLSEIKLNVKINETSRLSYDIAARGSAGGGREVDIHGRYQTNLLLSHHRLLLDLHHPDHTVTGLNVTALLTWNDASVAVEVRPDGGPQYRGVIRYTHNIDQLDVSTRSLDLDLNFPGKTVKITNGLSVGRRVTLTNRIQLDRSRDIVTRLVMDILQPKKKGVQLQIQWDPNRDPLKKFDVSLRRDWSDPTFSSVNATAFLGLLSNTYQLSWTSIALKISSNSWLQWEQRHGCRLQWEDTLTRDRQQVNGLAYLRFTRSDTAELEGNFQISTPFDHWRDNYFRVLYSRDSDRISGTVKSRWHDHEFFDAKIITEKSYESLRLFGANSSLDISSSFQGMTSLKTGATIHRMPGLMESNAFIQWEEDRVEVRLEGHDQSSTGLLDYSLFANAVTSLDGYRSLASELNFVASSNNINAKAAAHWDALNYELKCRGESFSSVKCRICNRYSGDDYLNGEISLLLPGYEQDDFYGQIKMYKDPVDQRHRLLTIGNWGGKTVKVEGHVTSERHDFHSSLSINTPFEGLPHALLVLGRGFDGTNHKSEARVAWGKNFAVGFELLGHFTSITDFLVSLAVTTPVQRFKEVKAEFRHLFDIDEEVRCHSRIFGQVGDKKYGLGGRYEQGKKPRIRVAFEAYTPLPMLELLSLDLSDNSAYRDSEYALKVLYGSNSPLHLTVGVVRGQDEEDWAVKAALPLSILNQELHDVEIDVVAGMNWGNIPRLGLSLLTDAGTVRKIIFKSILPPHGIGSLEASMGGFVSYPGYEHVSLAIDFAKPSYGTPGLLDLTFRTNGAGVTTLTAKGNHRSFDASFTSPIAPFRMGDIKWQSIATSVVQEKVSGSFRWETDAVTLEGTAHVRSGSLTRLEADISTPWITFESCRLTLDNTPTDSGATSHITFTSQHDTVVADVAYSKNADMKWEINTSVNHTSGDIISSYKTDMAYQFDSGKLFLSLDAVTPLPDWKIIKGSVDFMYPGPTYSGLVQWDTSVGTGRLDMKAERDHQSRSIVSSSSLTLQNSEQEDSTTYGLKVDLDNRSTDQNVDLDMSIELTSSLDNWDKIKVSGTVRQVTKDPGEVRLSLTWPHLAPVTFLAYASHEQGLTIIKPSISIEIENTKYGVSAEWETREDGELRILKVVTGMYNEGQPPMQIQVDSKFNVYLNAVDGTVDVRLPLPAPWDLSTARIEYNKDKTEHKFNVHMVTGGHEVDLEGTAATRPDAQVEGSVQFSSSLLWNKHPLKLSFKQSLTQDRYTGEYKVDFPRHNKQTDTWTQGNVEASLVHSFLPAGHKGLLTVHPAFLKLDPIKLAYLFEFPNSQDMTVQVKLSYKEIALGFKVEEMVVTQPDGVYRRRLTIELDNPLWPFGLANFKSIQPNRKRETVLEIYDLTMRNRKVSLSFVSNRADGGRKFSITMDLPDGRVVTLSTGYHWSDKKAELLLHFSWLDDQSLDLGFKWEDISLSGRKQHRVCAHVTHPFREVVLEADYSRLGATLDADFTFDWNARDSLNDVLRGQLQWQDMSKPGDRHYTGLLSLAHPSLQQDIRTNIVLRRNAHNPILANLFVRYAEDTARDLLLNFNITNASLQSGRRQYLTSVTARHLHSKLNLEGFNSVTFGDGQYGYNQQVSYTNSSAHDLNSTLVTVLDLHNKTLTVQMSGMGREVDLVLVVEKEGSGKWRVKAISNQNEELPVSGLVEIHPFHPLVSLTFENVSPDHDHWYSRSVLLNKKMMVRGGVEDMRNAVFSMSHVETTVEDPFFSSFRLDDDSSARPNVSETLVPDLNFYFRLNNTRLISSSLDWRPNLKEEIGRELAELAGISHTYRSGAREWAKEAIRAAVAEAAVRAKPILKDIKNQTREFMKDAKKIYTTMNLTRAEIKRRESLEFIINSFSSYITTTKAYAWLQSRLSGGGLRSRLTPFIGRVRAAVQGLLSGFGGSEGGLQRLKTSLAETYDKLAKRWYLKLSQVLSDFKLRLRTWLRSRWHTVYLNYQPHIITTLNNIETGFNKFVRTVSGTISSVKESLATSPYYQFITDYVNKIRGFLVSLFKRPLRENLESALDWIEDVARKTIEFLLTEIAPFLQDWVHALKQAWLSLEQYPLVQQLVDKLQAIADAVIWSVSNIEFRRTFIDVVSFSFENGYTIITQTALDAEHRQRRVKTHLYLDAERGHLEFVQKLPMPWLYFNVAPNWEDLKEWRFFKHIQTVLSGGKPIPVLDIWYKYYSLNADPRSWIPPFEASSEVVGQEHLVTWNGQLLRFRGLCRYLLAADLMSSRWAVVLNYHANAPNAYIIYLDGKQVELEQRFVVSEHVSVTIKFLNCGQKVKVDGRASQLPTVLPNTVIFRAGEELILRQTSGLLLRWNQLHDVFVVTLPGIYFNKVGGLLGTNNYEALDDLLSPAGFLSTDVAYLASTWSVSRGACEARTNTAFRLSSAHSNRCDNLFRGRTSPFKFCFYQVSPHAYDAMCRAYPDSAPESARHSASCAAASAFRQACSVAGVPTKIPHDCNSCEFEKKDGSTRIVSESQMTVIPLDDLPSSTDVVIIIEIGYCNNDGNIKRNLRNFFQSIDREMTLGGVASSRYTVVAYGGRDFFTSPQVMIAGKDLFSSVDDAINAILSIDYNSMVGTGHDNVDAFEALRYAANLPFRAGVVPTFFLMPCTACFPHVGIVSSERFQVFLPAFFLSKFSNLSTVIVEPGSEALVLNRLLDGE
ncbi:Lipid transport protein N-terminal [Trinorchestia longiramus]|nr:Lipid transport protein N-terminal [Trinorchestia longiramus]